MMAQINEEDSARHLQMTYVEFLEAIARAAEIMSFPPPTERFRNEYLKHTETDEGLEDRKIMRLKKNKNLDLDNEAVEMTDEECLNQDLHK